MDPDRWKQIEELFHDALQVPAQEREAFLRKNCEEPSIRQEVEELLDCEDRSEGFLEAPLLDRKEDQVASENGEETMLDRQIGPYKVHSLLGAGGMGTVYRAEDTRSGQIVALKSLTPAFRGDPEKVRRFLREAKATSLLKHENIAGIHEAGEADDVLYIAMEYVQGETIEDLLSHKELSRDAVLDIALQAAKALDEAHTKGIMHRDIKPSNLMISSEGLVKVLDFGLAKARSDMGAEGSQQLSMESLTKTGFVVGTVNYMSPEQVLGKKVDHRSDLFSLGIIMYEMITGKSPFPGDNLGVKISQILDSQPRPFSDIRGENWGDLEAIVRKCLRKDPDHRFNSARELVRELQFLSSGEAMDSEPESTSLNWAKLRWVGLLLLILLAIYWIIRNFQELALDGN
jgi:serine/threonine-protein kinase